MTKRERMIGIGVGVAAAIFVIDSYALTPYTKARDENQKKIVELADKFEKANKLIKKQRSMEKSWREMLQSGLKSDPAEAEQQILQSVRQWAQDAGLAPTSLKPDRVVRSDKTQLVRLNVTGTGSMASVAKLLWSIEKAQIPLKVDELQLTTRKEGTDDLAVTLSVSTLWVAPGDGKTPAAGAARAQAAVEGGAR
jgi:Tfp pilus assembly protein PilO